MDVEVEKKKEEIKLMLKERSKPVRLAQLKALERRLPTEHRIIPKLKEDIILREAGYRGEQSLDYYLNFLESQDFIFLHDLSLKGENGFFFQMDTVAICPQFIAIIEVKNLAGKICFYENTNQWIRKYNQKEEPIPSPIEQLKRQRMQLADWFINYAIPLKPILELAVFTNPSTYIESTSSTNQTLSRVILAEHLPTKLDALKKHYHTEKIKKSEQLKIATLLAKPINR
ncbi:nuclease-related domain-containing protein [Alkalicoccobacillus porphyridii]|nr:nuclease-related domain-containing protein [Alkalicoccobacillus porphyridii]